MGNALDQLRAARFDGEQALYTTAVKLLSERPAVPEDLAGLVERLRCSIVTPIADARAAADAIEALSADRDKWFEACGAHHVASMKQAQRADAAEARLAEAHAAGMREAALIMGSLRRENPNSLGSNWWEVAERAILAAIPQASTPVAACAAPETDSKGGEK